MTAPAAFELAAPARVLFGAGRLGEIGTLARELGQHALLVTGRSGERAAAVTGPLAAAGVRWTSFPVPGEPTLATARDGLAAARAAGCDVVIGFGGGSALDAAKAIATLLGNGGDPLDYLEVIGRGQPIARPAAPLIAVPTTAGTGSEVTKNAVLASPEHGAQGQPAQPAHAAAGGAGRSGPAAGAAARGAGLGRPRRAVAAHRAVHVEPGEPGHRCAGARGDPPIRGGAAAGLRRRRRRNADRRRRSRGAGAGQPVRGALSRQRGARRRARLRGAAGRDLRGAARGGLRGAVAGRAARESPGPRRARPRPPRPRPLSAARAPAHRASRRHAGRRCRLGRRALPRAGDPGAGALRADAGGDPRARAPRPASRAA